MAIAISQEAFDDMVRENMEDLGMDPDEALADAVDALTLQGANLSGTHGPSPRPLQGFRSLIFLARAITRWAEPLATSCRDHQARAWGRRGGGGEPGDAGAGRTEGLLQRQVGGGS